MTFVGNITILALCAPLFAVYAAVALDLALQLSALIAFALSISISFPELVIALGITVEMLLGIQAGVTLGLPSFSVQLGLGLSAQLTIVLGLIVAVNALLSLGAGAALEAFTYVGPGGATFGGAVGSALAAGWPDGTLPSAHVTAIVLVATSTGPGTGATVQAASLLGGGANYETGLCSVAIAPPPIGGTQATATPTVTSGVVTAISVTPGSGYILPPAMTISDTVAVLGATDASPIVLTIGNTTGITGLTVAGAEGNTAANGLWCAKILSGSTVALYQDGAFTVPSAGNGTYTGGGTATGNGTGAAAIAIMGGGAVRQLGGFFDGLAFPASGLSAGVSIGLNVMLAATFQLLVGLLGNLQLQARILATASAKIGLVPPAIAGNISIMAKLKANVQAAIKLQPPLPSIRASLSATLAAKIAIIASLVARIGIMLGFGTETLGVYTYSGPGSGLGPAISANVPGANATAVVLGATTSASQSAMAAFFAGA